MELSLMKANFCGIVSDVSDGIKLYSWKKFISGKSLRLSCLVNVMG